MRSYVIAAIIHDHCNDRNLPTEDEVELRSLIEHDLFAMRSRLSFIPPIPLPPTDKGRPAAYLLNRLSNNVEKLTLVPEEEAAKLEGNGLQLPFLLNYSLAACIALAGMEEGMTLPSDSRTSSRELKDTYDLLVSNSSEREKLDAFLELGRNLTEEIKIRFPLLVSIPAARVDLLKPHGPPSIKLETGHHENVHAKKYALTDYLGGRFARRFKTDGETKSYKEAQETIKLAHRLLAIQSSYLASVANALPIQIGEIGSKLYSVAKDLNIAITKRTRKVSNLFRRFEMELSDSLPNNLISLLAQGDSPVIFYSDLPFEWALLDNWPVCLTRPVSRIPSGVMSAWHSLTLTLRSHHSINVNHPERVLVIDLISKHDRKVRPFSDMFREVSDTIGQKYTYITPRDAKELKEIVSSSSPEVVVLDTHGQYYGMLDELFIYFGDTQTKAIDIIGDAKIPPVWILSACDMAVVGVITASLPGRLLSRGAICVIATLQKIDAYAASIFVGRLLTDIYSPPKDASYETLSDAFFVSQLTTAFLYDPLLPLLKSAQPGSEEEKKIKSVILDYLYEFIGKPINPKSIGYQAAEVLYHRLEAHGLIERQTETVLMGQVTPETLLFTAFGVPSNVHLVKDVEMSSE
ncbi:MAG: hypothetical protein DRH50_17150 [Deltaproteobacteria bacterium]|nr:MAG: hypothetical protein DRH50_17150 [Deltaproteobacteria bacterium]